MADENDSGELESAERSPIATVKTKRAVVKRSITKTLKKLQGTIEQYGRKSIIRGYVNILEESLNEAQVLNNQLLAMFLCSCYAIILIVPTTVWSCVQCTCNSGYIITNVYETKTKRFIHGSQKLGTVQNINTSLPILG